MKNILSGAIACLLVLCQWFVFRSVIKYFWPNVERINRAVAYSALIGFGLLTILAVRLEFGSELFPAGTIGPQLVSTMLRSYLGWVVVLSLFFLFLRMSEWLAAFRNIPVPFSRIKEVGRNCSENELDREAKSTGNQSHCLTDLGPGKVGQMTYPRSTRRRFLKVAAASSLTIATGIGIKGVANAYSPPVVEKHRLACDALQGLTRPITLIHATDSHFGMFFGPHELRNMVDHLNSLEGDALFFTGDVFHSFRTLVEEATPILAKLKARPLGNFAVLGNHDFYAGEDRSVRNLEAAGFTLLRNQWTTLKVEDATIHLGGIDDPVINWVRTHEVWAFDPFLEKVPLEPGVTVLLSHRPDVFRYAAEQKIDIVLAGHTHGGQIVIPVPRRERGVSIANIVSKYTSGWYRKKSSRMYVNRGVGLTFLPWRLRCPAEIAIIKLSATSTRPIDV
jgi:predicted MPP superfamily phosphohydrolase